MHLNDAKHAKLLTLTGEESGHIDDLEHRWLKLTIVAPTDGVEHINDLWDMFLEELGFSTEYEWLASLGYTGTITDMWYQYWTA